MPKRLPAALLAIGLAAPAHAGGIPVIDVTAISQLIQQIAYWQQPPWASSSTSCTAPTTP